MVVVLLPGDGLVVGEEPADFTHRATTQVVPYNSRYLTLVSTTLDTSVGDPNTLNLDPDQGLCYQF